MLINVMLKAIINMNLIYLLEHVSTETLVKHFTHIEERITLLTTLPNINETSRTERTINFVHVRRVHD